MSRLKLNLLGKSNAEREQAARLHLRLEERNRPQDRQAAESWMADSESHAEAFHSVQETWEQARDSASAPEILSLRQETLARVALRGHSARYRLMAASLVACLVATTAWLVLLPATPDSPTQVVQAADVYRTSVGQRLTVALADGSKVTLNTASQVRVNYSGSERSLQLDSGEAFFQVAKDRQRPFRVRASGHSIIAYGTAFDVRIDGQELRVGLIEGNVGVTGEGREVRLKPNNLLIAAAGKMSVEPLADAAALTSWSEGFIIFNDQPVTDAVRELNRYLTSPIVVADDELARTHISGSFRTGEAESFVEALNYYVPTRSTTDSSGRIILKRR